MSFNNGFQALTQISHMHEIFSLDFTIKTMLRISTYCNSLVTQIGEVLEDMRTKKIVKSSSFYVTLNAD
jgi:hypothetical protein